MFIIVPTEEEKVSESTGEGTSSMGGLSISENFGQSFIVDTPGTTRLIRRKPTPIALANLTPGNDGLTESGEDALTRLKSLTFDLEALGAKPRYLLGLTLPQPQSPGEWREAKKRLLSPLGKRIQRVDGGLCWWQGFQKNGSPHLHVLVDPGNRRDWAEWLHWAKSAWERAIGQPIPLQSVDLKLLEHRDFRYARSSHTLKQAVAPYKAQWGHWFGIAGIWAELKARAVAETVAVEVLPEVAQAVALGLANQAALPSVAHRLNAFAEGQPSMKSIWVAKNLIIPEERERGAA